ncbi:response regulator [Microbulbifer rhizosphaerae]|uniref:CheY-like chemotaxis protein n=1 Tax=Microbulbifer rhizosphaerae TaxID=1562603 RepID=A0A7W4WFJ3_9GAMM|nr:response regulator [Microbulbifer rhizosphaerae]MBB3063288.1 CheY-like chemotaxis protein [Microbulbifer rhizosphaerae]
MNILIAEDTPTIQVFNCTLLSSWGFNFDMASDGAEAIGYAYKNKGKYDLCLMDIEMPKMNGIEAARIIRRELPYFPIAAITADPSYRSECLAAGMDEFVQKPCTPNRLFATIRDLSIKPLLVKFGEEDISIVEAMPMNPKELQELRELKKQGLTKLKLLGLNHAFIVHRNIQNKISHDLIGEGKELSEFIDRSPSEPGRCQLYKANLHVTKDLLLPEELEEEMHRENEIAVRFNGATERYTPDD